MSSFRRSVVTVGKSIVYSLDLVLFLFFFMLNMYLFAKYTDSVLFREGVVGFAKALLKFLFAGGSIGPLVHDIGMVSLGTGIILASWTLLLRRRARVLALTIMNTVILLIVLADLMYFRYFEDLLSIVVFTQIGQLGDVNSSIKALFRSTDWIFLAEAVVTLALGITIFRRLDRTKPKLSAANVIIKSSMFVIVAAFGAVTAWYPLHILDKYGGSDFFKKAVSAETIYKRTGLIGFHAFDTYRSVEGLFQSYTVNANDYNMYKQWFQEHDAAIGAETSYRGIAEGKNVLIVQVEALQNFVINQSIDGQIITPNLNELVKESLYFDHFYHQTAQGRTSDAEFTVKTSLQPLAAGSVYVRFPKNDYDALPSILKRNGYDTAAFHAFRAGFWNRNVMYRNIGYNRFYSASDFVYEEKKERIGWGLNDIGFLKQTVGLLDSSVNKPFFGFAVTLTSHHPFYLPEQLKTITMPSYSDPLFMDYIHTIHYMDQAIGELVKDLKDKGLWDNTVLVIYGDHDSGLVKNDSELPEFAVGNYDSLEFEQLKKSVPLIIHLPGGQMAEVRSEVGGMTDVAPTVLHLLGIDVEQPYMTGKNLLAGGERFVPFRDGSATDGEYWFADGGKGTLEGGRCYRMSDSTPADAAACSNLYNRAQQLYKLSDDLIFGNLLKKFKSEDNVGG
ncbi:LTA synthase family protein [Paenibacillus motobuensis]|uniref:LTA synthase family protein n=1 Tax=Paenibacillus motobuensis TaxID=295324 RepID=UPI0036343A74